ncbi:16S rRNA (guanine1207-N2)-methyltransferase [Pseudarthrobacter enclensis]|uniref:16S rRNA (Guanine1207-N2)-methyltransferase n=1 Tax=Pseudarthrobacter enclensis TaxID=993070 RepID=A0ABT9RRX7_9MICC|nr:class I SAM-dependent methyltransferase [Pseudarthrobacter enclensis]MDP9887989.1 16S rRNA (guanine1207-N2)-methyltransferase [Pseudarthrobacter enclensis]
MTPVAANTLEDIFRVLRRRPDVEAPNLQAWDATDRLLLETAVQLGRAGSKITVIGDRYGALTLGASAVLAPASLRVHQDLITGERALRLNAAALVGEDGHPPGPAATDAAHTGNGFVQLPLGPELLAEADTVLLQLPKTLAELEEVAALVARHAAPGIRLLAGGRVKHMSLGMNAVLERYFVSVQPQLARQKSRILLACGPRQVTTSPRFPVVEHLAELDLDVAAHGAVFAGPRLDIGTRFLLTFLPSMKPARHAVDLGCGTGILAAMYARQFPAASVTATDQSAAAVQSALATARANGLADRITVLQDDALSTFPDGTVETVLLNPPFHVGAGVHAGAGLKMIGAAGRVLAPGGELWTVFNRHLAYVPALERLVGPTDVEGRNAKFTVTRSRRPTR